MKILKPIAAATAFMMFALCAGEAAAWGPKAREAIARAGLQIARRSHPMALRGSNQQSYDQDFVRGATEGYTIIRPTLTLGTDELAITAITGQIHLLREARKYGMGSYFAYRVGVLSSLVSDLFLPTQGLRGPSSDGLRERIDEDIEDHYASYSFRPNTRQQLVFVYGPAEYFATKRPFARDATKMIADDYRAGVGYDGVLSKAGEVYFGRAIESVADIVHTVLKPERHETDTRPSPRSLTEYFVGEIEYLLNERKNFAQAERAYNLFRSVNRSDYGAYERVGDLFYAFGTEESVAKGLREWKIAYGNPGRHRESVSRKLGNHYMAVGNAYFESSLGPEARDTDLDSALRAFTSALEYDRFNSEAARRINETNDEIKAKEERYQLLVTILASAETLMQEGDRARIGKAYDSAITAYNRAIEFLDAVDTEFQDLADQAQKKIRDLRNNIRDVARDVIADVDARIQVGDDALAANNFDEALAQYQSAVRTLEAFPEDGVEKQFIEQKNEALGRAQRKLDQAKARQQESAEQAAQPPATKFTLKKGT